MSTWIFISFLALVTGMPSYLTSARPLDPSVGRTYNPIKTISSSGIERGGLGFKSLQIKIGRPFILDRNANVLSKYAPHDDHVPSSGRRLQ